MKLAPILLIGAIGAGLALVLSASANAEASRAVPHPDDVLPPVGAVLNSLTVGDIQDLAQTTWAQPAGSNGTPGTWELLQNRNAPKDDWVLFFNPTTGGRQLARSSQSPFANAIARAHGVAV